MSESSLKKGLFVVLEGIDGSGTTTQLLALERELGERGIPVVATREPTSGPVGGLLRGALEKRLRDASGSEVSLDWTTLALLFAADRRDHLVREIEPALERGALVISDRYYLSSLLYQSATSPEGAGALPWLVALNSKARKPDLTLVLTIDAEVAEARRKTRGGAEELFEASPLQRKLADGYARAQEYLTDEVVILLRAEQSVAEITRQLLDEILKRFFKNA
jgi:dTMP kinase